MSSKRKGDFSSSSRACDDHEEVSDDDEVDVMDVWGGSSSSQSARLSTSSGYINELSGERSCSPEASEADLLSLVIAPPKGPLGQLP